MKKNNFNLKNRQLFLGSSLMLLIKGLSIIVSLITLPLYLNFISDQSLLGIWFTIVSVLTWILTFDMGLGNGLRNKLTISLSKNDFETSKSYISSAYITILGVIILIFPAGFFLINNLNWNNILNISNQVIDVKSLENLITIMFISISIQFFLKTITSIFYALQKSFIPSFLTLCSSVSILIMVSILNHFKNDSETNLVYLSYINLVCTNLPLAIATIYIFFTKKYLTPSITNFNRLKAIEIISLGGVFFWIQIMTLIIFNTNEILISYLASPKYVVEYQIYNKFFILLGTLFNIALTPLWSSITAAKVEGDFDWIRKIYKKIINISYVAFLIQALIVILLPHIVQIWIPNSDITINYKFAIIFAIAGCLNIWVGIHATIVNGLGELKVSVIFLTIGALLNPLLAVYLNNLHPGWIIIIIANCISLLPFAIVQPLVLNKILRKNQNEMRKKNVQ